MNHCFSFSFNDSQYFTSYQTAERLNKRPVKSETAAARVVETASACFGRQTSFVSVAVNRKISDGFGETFFVKFSKIAGIYLLQFPAKRPKFFPPNRVAILRFRARQEFQKEFPQIAQFCIR